MANKTTIKSTATPVKPPGLTPKKIDPGISHLRKVHQDAVKDYKRVRVSAAIVDTIINKRLPRLVDADREKLLDLLMATTTRGFPTSFAASNAPSAPPVEEAPPIGEPPSIDPEGFTAGW